MKTDELIGLLAMNAAPVPRRAGERRLALALAVGLPLAVLWLYLSHGLRPDLAQQLSSPGFWLKLALPTAVAAGALLAVFRLSHPGSPPPRGYWSLWLPLSLVWLGGLAALAQAEPAARSGMVWGATWASCSISVAATAVPLWLAVFWAVRGLAPTRPGLTGAVAGWLAGAGGAAVYVLHCPESSLPFLAVWYVLGMAIPAVLGAVAGRWLLRW